MSHPSLLMELFGWVVALPSCLSVGLSFRVLTVGFVPIVSLWAALSGPHWVVSWVVRLVFLPVEVTVWGNLFVALLACLALPSQLSVAVMLFYLLDHNRVCVSLAEVEEEELLGLFCCRCCGSGFCVRPGIELPGLV